MTTPKLFPGHFLLIGGFLLTGVVGGCHCPKSQPRTDGGPDSGLDAGPDSGPGDGGPDAGPDAGPGDAGPLGNGNPGPGTFGIPDGGLSLDGGNGEVGSGVQLDPDGGVILGSSDFQFQFMWIANNNQGTVSKFDTQTGKEVARYDTAIPIQGVNGTDGKPLPSGVQRGSGNNPSRTAIDLNGDMWVGNRAVNVPLGSVTKIANFVGTSVSNSDCIDRNGNKVIDTSRDLNGDGQITLDEMIIPSDPTDYRQYDECILFSTPVGSTNNDGSVKVRAMAIAKGNNSAGDIWVGHYRDQAFFKLRSSDGQMVPPAPGNPAMSVSIPFGPYGAAVDSQQRLWAVYPGYARLALIDTLTGKLINDNLSYNGGAYGIAIDGKDRVWLPGWGYGAKALRYVHSGLSTTPGTWTQFDFTSAIASTGKKMGYGRGIAADDQGYVWMSGTNYDSGGGAALLIGFNQETGAIKKFVNKGSTFDFVDATDSQSFYSIGVGVDANNQLWVNNNSGNVMRVDRDTGEVLKSASQSPGLYSYSDFTGYQLKHFTVHQGSFKQTVHACADGYATSWKSVVWDQTTPPGTSIQVSVQVANSLSDLNNNLGTRLGPFSTSPGNLSALPDLNWIRAEFDLKGDGSTSPTLKTFHFDWICNSTIN